VLGLLPTKGLALPFVSYGGSSLLVNAAAAGILLSISRPRSNEEPKPAARRDGGPAPSASALIAVSADGDGGSAW